jgi:tellurite resistance protein TehA-like permease
MQYTIHSAAYYQLAQAYGDGNFSASTYGGATTTTTSGDGTPSGGGLVNTGVAIAGFVTLACIVLLAAIVVRVWRRDSKKPAVETTNV